MRLLGEALNRGPPSERPDHGENVNSGMKVWRVLRLSLNCSRRKKKNLSGSRLSYLPVQLIAFSVYHLCAYVGDANFDAKFVHRLRWHHTTARQPDSTLAPLRSTH